MFRATFISSSPIVWSGTNCLCLLSSQTKQSQRVSYPRSGLFYVFLAFLPLGSVVKQTLKYIQCCQLFSLSTSPSFTASFFHSLHLSVGIPRLMKNKQMKRRIDGEETKEKWLALNVGREWFCQCIYLSLFQRERGGGGGGYATFAFFFFDPFVNKNFYTALLLYVCFFLFSATGMACGTTCFFTLRKPRLC